MKYIACYEPADYDLPDITGPFDNEKEAQSWAESAYLKGGWWVQTINPPPAPKKKTTRRKKK